MPLQVAIVGAGPSGFYAAAALLQADESCRLDIIEALPTPFGLIRAGVAPDHQSTKGVSRAFARTAQAERVGYFGNVLLGRDVSLDELRGLYDAVVLATGAPQDRPLGIPGGEAAGVYGAAAFVGWYNGHPDFCDLAPDLNTAAVAVIGNGNVAIDVARVLAKTPAEMASSDLADNAAAVIHKAPIEDIYLIGRRGPVEAKFTNKELSEMGDLADCVPLVDPAQLPAEVADDMSDRDRRLREKNLATLRDFSRRQPGEKRKRVHFLFYAAPVEVLHDARVHGLRLERTRVEGGRAVGTGETFVIPCGVVVSAIGYRMPPLPGVPMDERTGVVAHRDGRIAEGLYAVGWAKRGPVGVIGTNKADGDLVARQITETIAAAGRPGGPGLWALLAKRGVRLVSFADWQRIDAAEVAMAPPGAPRRKLIRIKDMLAVLRQTEKVVSKS
ncbi:MAG TPA: FAD-dependent oxidoreductase [Kiloniellales bacterium]